MPERDRFFITKLCYVKRMPELYNGFYFIKQKNKRNIYGYVFSYKNKIYYIDFFTSSTFEIKKRVFDSILLSIKDIQLKEEFDKKEIMSSLNSICFKTFYILCHSVQGFFIAMPIMALAMFLIIFSLVTKGMGKLPDNDSSLMFQTFYREEDVSTTISLPLKSLWILTALTFNEDGIHVFYRKKRLLFIPKSEVKERFIPKKDKNKYHYEVKINLKKLKNAPVSLKRTILQDAKLKLYPKGQEEINLYLSSL